MWRPPSLFALLLTLTGRFDIGFLLCAASGVVCFAIMQSPKPASADRGALRVDKDERRLSNLRPATQARVDWTADRASAPIPTFHSYCAHSKA